MEKRKNLKGTKEAKAEEESKKKQIIIAVILLSFAFFGSFLIFFILQQALNTSTPMVVVASGSMEPNMYKGDLLFLEGKDAEDIKEGTESDKEGDVIVFDASDLWDGAPDDPIVHRVIDKWYNKSEEEWYFRTKGDANTKKDEEPIPESKILGVVVGRVPAIGWIKIILTETGLLIPLLVIISVPLVISILYDIWKDEEEEKDKIIEKSEETKVSKKKKEPIQEHKEPEEQLSKKDDFDF